MIVVSDTTPLRYLVEIEVVEILPELFGQIIIPIAVSEELQHPKTPHKIKPGFNRDHPGLKFAPPTLLRLFLRFRWVVAKPKPYRLQLS